MMLDNLISEFDRGLRTLFAPAAHRPGHDAVIAFTTDFLRGFVQAFALHGLESLVFQSPIRLKRGCTLPLNSATSSNMAAGLTHSP